MTLSEECREWAKSIDRDGDIVPEQNKDIQSLQNTIDKQADQISKLQQWNTEMVAKAASGGTLDGYRDMARQLAEKDAEIERLQTQVERMRWFLDSIGETSFDENRD